MSGSLFSDARILVVDDNDANVALLAAMLDRWGYRNVVSTTDSSRVIGLCAETAFDLVLLDLRMPPPDGFELLQSLSTRSSPGAAGSPVIVLTADNAADARHEALLAGASDVITKPFEPADVLERVRNMLDTDRA